MFGTPISQGKRRGGCPAILASGGCLIAIAATVLIGHSSAAQGGIPAPKSGLDRQEPSSRLPMQPPEDAPVNPEFQARRIRTLNLMRHKAMVDDAEKLLILARELNDDSGSLSRSDRVRKAAEIEKLAKSVKEKMSFTMDQNTLPTPYSIKSP